ncbi:nucleotide-diphospho-sugar transferase [Westerdykella ornata]|uniref:Nucleotide-diphospho-sugar transferase n=1 Tax=Westerdykella ornata TaxID=318751 RepID=A0A6A6J8W2_WESOR|nr:nucleotide-diphospho-sugar transferase [Westerdykella ornata]KAF2272785.1 nucleotide-diphospho-sugar transferase [Westerdykella ornata]
MAVRRLRTLLGALILLIGGLWLYSSRQEEPMLPHTLLETPIQYLKNGGSDQNPKGAGEANSDPRYTAHLDLLSQPVPDQHSPVGSQPEVKPSPPSSGNAPELPPSLEGQAQNLDSNTKTSEPFFAFQKDLDLELPVATFQSFSNHRPHNHDYGGPKKYAYATFMATRNPSTKDPYYLAIHSVLYRILYSPRSRTEQYPFIVYVADFVTEEQRTLLRGAGAIVRELEPLPWSCDRPGGQERWKDLFAKLNMWKETEFERILFLDADAFPVDHMDPMFDLTPLQDCRKEKLQEDDYLEDASPVCEPYVFGGVPQDITNPADYNINVGSMVFAPSERMHQRLLQNYLKTDKYNCSMAEQAFLNWQFQPDGAFPPTLLTREWGGFFPQPDEEGKLKVVHEKIWVVDQGISDWLKLDWLTQWQEMMAFYNGDEFKQAREKDGADRVV